MGASINDDEYLTFNQAVVRRKIIQRLRFRGRAHSLVDPRRRASTLGLSARSAAFRAHDVCSRLLAGMQMGSGRHGSSMHVTEDALSKHMRKRIRVCYNEGERASL